MRLYVKLFLMLTLTGTVQGLVNRFGEQALDAWFASRCWIAYRSDDQILRENLVAEHQLHLQRQISQALHLAATPTPATPSTPSVGAAPWPAFADARLMWDQIISVQREP